MDFFRIYGLLAFALAFTAFSVWSATIGGNGSWAFVAAGACATLLGLLRAQRLKGAGNAR